MSSIAARRLGSGKLPGAPAGSASQKDVVKAPADWGNPNDIMVRNSILPAALNCGSIGGVQRVACTPGASRARICHVYRLAWIYRNDGGGFRHSGGGLAPRHRAAADGNGAAATASDRRRDAGRAATAATGRLGS